MAYPHTDRGRRLTTADVMDVYGLSTPRAARKFMKEVGAFTVAGRLLVREADVVAWEERQIAARGPAPSAARSSGPSAPSRPRRSPEKRPRGWDHRDLPADFFMPDSQTDSTPR